MIRYPLPKKGLPRSIRDEKASWFDRAEKLVEKSRKAKRHVGEGIWSEIKQVFMTVQKNKCAYCERVLDTEKIEHDVEHFRPKNAVKNWPSPAIRKRQELKYDFEMGDAWNEGYYLLAHEPLNYLISCKHCNSIQKSNYFPVEGPRGPQADKPAALKSEKPLLIYPLGSSDANPEDLIEFDGPVPVPRHSTGAKFRRARVTIDLFDLGNEGRFANKRLEKIFGLWHALENLASRGPARNRSDAALVVNHLTSCRSDFTNCLRSFHRLYKSDRKRAEKIIEPVRDYMRGVS